MRRGRTGLAALGLIAAAPAAAQIDEAGAPVQIPLDAATGRPAEPARIQLWIDDVETMLRLAEHDGGFVVDPYRPGTGGTLSKAEATELLTQQVMLGELTSEQLFGKVQQMRRQSNANLISLRLRRDKYRTMLAAWDRQKRRDQAAGPAHPVPGRDPVSAIPVAEATESPAETLAAAANEKVAVAQALVPQLPAANETDEQAAVRKERNRNRLVQTLSAIGTVLNAIGDQRIAGQNGGGQPPPPPVPADGWTPPATGQIGAGTAPPAAAAPRWAGQWNMSNFGVATVTGDGSFLRGSWRTPDGGHAATIDNCSVAGNQARCVTNGKYTDKLLSVTYRGVIDLTLEGDVIRAKHTIVQANETWFTDPFDFPIRQGAVLPMTLTRIN